jgi:hypothetical protein
MTVMRPQRQLAKHLTVGLLGVAAAAATICAFYIRGVNVSDARMIAGERPLYIAAGGHGAGIHQAVVVA